MRIRASSIRSSVPALALLVGMLQAAPIGAAPKKLVYYGWGAPTSMYVASHAAEMEQMPFDGTGIIIPIDRVTGAVGNVDTSNRLGWRLFGTERFAPAQFADAIAELAGTHWTRFTDNFLVAVPNSALQGRDFSWFDDARWDGITTNWRLFLKIARRARTRGVILDPEDYGGRIFDYRAMAARRPASFTEYQAMARARGRRLMRAGRRIFPGLVILALYGPSLPLDPRSDAELATTEYALYPAFVAGLLEGADPAFRFVDGCEFSYGYDRPGQFTSMRGTMTDRFARRGLLPEVRQRRLQYGFGLWIDKGGAERWFPDQPWRNWFSADRLNEAATAALKASDEYVWVYSQVARFFPPRALPTAYVEALEQARHGGPHGSDSGCVN